MMESAATLELDDIVVSATGVDRATKDTTMTASSQKASANTTNSAEEEMESPSHPKGIRFVILFLSILAGNFFVGYVRNIMDIPLIPSPRRHVRCADPSPES